MMQGGGMPVLTVNTKREVGKKAQAGNIAAGKVSARRQEGATECRRVLWSTLMHQCLQICPAHVCMRNCEFRSCMRWEAESHFAESDRRIHPHG